MDNSTLLSADPDPEATVRCSDWARTVSLSPTGTCGSYPGYLLVEIPLPWPRDAGETAEGAAVSSLIGPLRYRLQAVVPTDPDARPQERRVILHARPPGSTEFSGYRRFESRAGDSLADTVAALLAAAADESPSELESPAVDVLLCTHGTRDSCCGRLGAGLAVKLAETDPPTETSPLTGANLWRTSHMGGHRFAPTFLVLPQGTSWGFADVDLVTRVLRQEGDFAAVAGRYRGCTGLGSPQVQALETAVLREAGWRLLARPRTGEFDGTQARLSWRDGDQAISYTGDVRAGRMIPMPGCLAPASPADKTETEWAVTAVRRR